MLRFVIAGITLSACGGGGGGPAVDVGCEPAPAGSQTFQCTIKVRDRGPVDYQVQAGERRLAAGRTDKVAVTRLGHVDLAGARALTFAFARGDRSAEQEIAVPGGFWYEVDASQASGVAEPRITVLTAPENQVKIDGRAVTGAGARFVTDLPLIAEADVARLPNVWRTVTIDIAAPTGERVTVTRDVAASAVKMFAEVGRGLPWMAAHQPAAGPRPTLIVARGPSPAFAGANGLRRVGDAELIAVVEHEQVDAGSCPGLGYCPPDQIVMGSQFRQRCKVAAGRLQRWRLRSQVELLVARTGERIAGRSFDGPIPVCPEVFDFASKSRSVPGEPPMAAIAGWLRHPR